LISHSRIAAHRRAFVAAVLAATAVIAAPAAFAQSKESGAKGADAGGKEYTVVMSNMDYGSIPPGLKVGDTVVWQNHDTVIHSVTARDHSFDLRLNPGQSAKLTLMTAGKIPIYCLFHPNMRGTLSVAPK
jgi:plastocyanin